VNQSPASTIPLTGSLPQYMPEAVEWGGKFDDNSSRLQEEASEAEIDSAPTFGNQVPVKEERCA
jgi:hypothetical protein